jgi:hypothetical protein
MKIAVFSLALCLAAFSQLGLAQDGGSLNGFRNHAFPVLVRVNDRGKVTDVQPSVTLSPRTDRLLRANLGEMIAKPAMVKGRPVSSIFVIQLALHTEKQSDGKYRAHFSYVSSIPVPPGSWYWVHINGHRLALVEDDGHGHRHYLPAWRPWGRHYVPWTPQDTTVFPSSFQSRPAFPGGMPVRSRRMPSAPRGR